MNYSFSVTGVDRAERTGGESETARITWDGKWIDYWSCDIYILVFIIVPESVIDLNFTLTDDESFNLITVILTWKVSL